MRRASILPNESIVVAVSSTLIIIHHFGVDLELSVILLVWDPPVRDIYISYMLFMNVTSPANSGWRQASGLVRPSHYDTRTLR